MYTPKADQAFTRDGTRLSFPGGLPLDAPEDKPDHWIYNKKGQRCNSQLAHVMTVIYRDILKPKYGNQKKFAAAAEKFARRHKINVDFKSQSFVSHLHTCQSLISKDHVALYSGMSGVPTGDIDPNRVTSLTQPKNFSSAADGHLLYVFTSGEIAEDWWGYTKIGITKDIRKRLKEKRRQVNFDLYLYAHWDLGVGVAKQVEDQTLIELEIAGHSPIPNEKEIFCLSPDDLHTFIYRAQSKVYKHSHNSLFPLVAPPDLTLISEQLRSDIEELAAELDLEPKEMFTLKTAWHPFDTS